jgi:hypothetical protein
LSDPKAFARYLAPLRDTEWVVYAKRPFGGPEQVLEYLGRYTHRVAIANQRLVSAEEGQVAFRWKDYRHQHRQKTMTLQADEFIRRFLLHALPGGLQRIRHYGLLGNRNRARNLARCRELLDMPPPPAGSGQPLDYRTFFEQLTGRSLLECPQCHVGHMVEVGTISRPLRLPKFIDTS